MITDDMLVKNLNIDLLVGSESINRELVNELDKLNRLDMGIANH
jgi:hypothetical protein